MMQDKRKTSGWLGLAASAACILGVVTSGVAQDPFLLPLAVKDANVNEVYTYALASEYPTAVRFDASGSVGYGGAAITSYAWDFGDGANDVGAIVEHTYAAKGAYEVTVTVTDVGGVSRYKKTKIFVLNDPTSVHTITATAGAGGAISPSGAVTVAEGGSRTFTITENSGYEIADVAVDGASVGAVSSYTFNNVTADHAIAATFQASGPPPPEVIVDNLDPNTSQVGTWTASSGVNPWDGNSVYQNSGGSFRWIPDLGAAGEYDVYVWWTYHSNRSMTVPYRVRHASGTAAVTVNQSDSALGGQWNLLGRHTFSAGSGGYVEVSSENGQACADAVKLALVGSGPITHTITASAGAGGSISPSGAVTVTEGDSQTFTITESSGYEIADVAVDGASVGAVSSYTFNNVTADHAIAATFSLTPPATHTITASAGAGGSISPSGAVTVTEGDSQTFTITENSGYEIADVAVDGASVGAVSSYTFNNVTADHTIHATFDVSGTPPPEVIVDNLDPNTSQVGVWTASSGVNPWDGNSMYQNSGGSFRWIPDLPAAGEYDVYVWWTYHNNRSTTVPYRVRHASGTETVTVNQHDSALGGQWNLLGRHTFDAGSGGYVEVSSENGQACADAVKLTPVDSGPITRTITASAGAGGSISPSGAVTVAEGDSQTFTITESSGYEIADVAVDGASVGAVSSYTFNNVTADHAIAATFQASGPPPEVIVDNLDPNTSQVGTWTTSSGANPWVGNSVYQNSGGSFRWIPDLPAAGEYDVYVWWTYHNNRSTTVPYRVRHVSGTETVTVNQHDSALGGQWNLLGTHTFAAGSGGYVEVSSENGQACADAVKLVAAGAALTVLQYDIVDVGTLGGATSEARGLSGAGLVVGQSVTEAGDARAFLYDGTQLLDLGTLGGAMSCAEAVNEHGAVVGRSTDALGNTRAFLHDGAQMTGLGTLGGASSQAYAINDAGEVVGYAQTTGGDYRGFVWTSAKGMIELLTLGGSSGYAFGINSAGRIVGQSETADGAACAFLDDVGAPVDLGTLGGTWSVALGVNDAGDVGGSSSAADGSEKPFIHRGVRMVELATLAGGVGRALSVNANGEAVGWSQDGAGKVRASLWDEAGSIMDLNDVIPLGGGWVLEEATGIADDGSIAGVGLLNGERRAFMLVVP